MGRVALQYVAIFVLPFLLYALYLFWRRRQAKLAGLDPPVWEAKAVSWLFVAGLVLVIAAFVVGDFLIAERDPNKIYVPQSREPR
jgi:uncharacterized iron-regulated membrane protein